MHAHTQVTQLPEPSGLAPTFHQPGTLLCGWCRQPGAGWNPTQPCCVFLGGEESGCGCTNPHRTHSQTERRQQLQQNSVGLTCGSVGDLLFLLGVQVPHERVPFVNQYDQLVQQQLLSSLLGLRLLPVCNHSRRTNWFRPSCGLKQKPSAHFIPQRTRTEGSWMLWS